MYIDIFSEPKSERSPIFLNNDAAIEYLIKRGDIKLIINYPKFSNNMKIMSVKRVACRKAYRCSNVCCRKILSLLYFSKLCLYRVSICDIFLLIYKWLENGNEKDTIRNVNRSKGLYQSIKCLLNQYASELYISNLKLGGPGIKVQVDGTVICHGRLEDCPSRLEDDFPGITWLVGFIEENSKKIKYEIVPDRKLDTFKLLFERSLNPGTIVISDGHMSYPGAIAHINRTHKIVNHNIVFKNVEGFHTNNIENLWSLMKYEIKKRKVVLKSNIPNFLTEFNFCYNFIRNRSSNQIFDAFSNIISFIFHE